MRLKRVGFFRELRHGAPDGPELKSMRRQEPLQNEGKIVAYLKGGTFLIQTPHVAKDALNPDRWAGSPHIMTDGIWAWPGDLPYYVETYHVLLPREFLKHMARMNWKAPAEGTLSIKSLEF